MSYHRRNYDSGSWRDEHYQRYRETESHYPSSQEEPYYDERRAYHDQSYSRYPAEARYDYGYPSMPSSDDHYYGASASQDTYAYPRYDEQRDHRRGQSHSRERRDMRRPSPPREEYVKAYNHPHNDRPVTPPPPRCPSPTYIKTAEQLPARLGNAADQRKLLILDLNGTLVHRAAPTRPKNKTTPLAHDEHGRPLPRLRPVHPRPYMPAFRSYLFAPQNKAWLDVMVWSSAQPHSVGDMVDKCFGEDKEGLIAIWARDTLGLSADYYHRKVQTTKDLNTPWSKLSDAIQASDTQSIASSRESSPVEESQRPQMVHSALTTLLLDDSPRKAELQPYNHFCVPEYSGEMRAKDLELLYLEQNAPDPSTEIAADERVASHTGSPPRDVAEAIAPATEVDEDSRKRKRKEKKELKRDAKREAAREALTSQSRTLKYDETLLAVIGVLDAVRLQANTAAWIRSGGLWGPDGRPTAAPEEEYSNTASSSNTSSSAITSSEAAQGNGDALQAQKPSQDDDKTPEVEARDSKRRRHRTQSPEVAQGSALPPVGNDAESSTQPDQDNAVAEQHQSIPSMWFEHSPTVEYWVERGKQALRDLDIPVHHGIER